MECSRNNDPTWEVRFARTVVAKDGTQVTSNTTLWVQADSTLLSDFAEQVMPGWNIMNVVHDTRR